MTAEPIEGARHGTITGYFSQECRCEACTAACRDYIAERRRKLRGTDPPQHGTNYAYQTFGCRCAACSKAAADDVRERRERRKRLFS